MITPSSYTTNLGKAEKDLEYMVNSYLKDPTAENVHGLRTATRRMLTISQLLPKRTQGEKSKERLAKFEKLLQLTNEIRHLDIALSRTPTGEKNQATEKLAKILKKNREGLLPPARTVAAALKKAVGPEIRAKDIPETTLQKRFKKLAEKLSGRIQKLLPIVIKDSKKQRQLHRLRQDSRRLRYILELSSTPQESESLTTLRSWQEVLATIHDNDVCIKRFQNKKESPGIGTLLQEMTAEREQNYRKFKSMAEAKTPFKLVVDARSTTLGEPEQEEQLLTSSSP